MKSRSQKPRSSGASSISEIARLLGRDERIKRNYLHAERARPRRHRAANSAQADDAKCLALQLDADESLAVPMSRFQTGVRLRHAARQRNQERDGVFGGCDRVAVRRVHHHDAAFSRRRHIDVVDAYAGATDHAQRAVHCPSNRSDFSFTADHQTCIISELARKFVEA